MEDKTVKVTLLFGATHIYATATNREGSEIRNCEFKFECSGTDAGPTEDKKKKGPQEEETKD